jgi:hypothetical protein
MRQLINKNDIKKLIGRWIIQLTNEEEDFTLLESKNDGFWLEKRISFVGAIHKIDQFPDVFVNRENRIIMNGLYYCHGIFTEEEFIQFFNNYINEQRFHRLLTHKELDWLNDRIKSTNY